MKKLEFIYRKKIFKNSLIQLNFGFKPFRRKILCNFFNFNSELLKNKKINKENSIKILF